MRYELAADKQLLNIISHDNECPAPLLSGVSIELIKRKLWCGIICYAGRKAYRNLNFTLQYGLKISQEEFIHIGHIEIMKIISKFQPGMRTFKTYVIMCLIAKFKKMKRDAEAEKRIANIGTKNVDRLDPKIQDKLFQAPVNVERYVINKITIEEGFECLREVEKMAILLDQQGYSQFEIAKHFGMNRNYGNVLLKRAYAKLRKSMGA